MQTNQRVPQSPRTPRSEAAVTVNVPPIDTKSITSPKGMQPVSSSRAPKSSRREKEAGGFGRMIATSGNTVEGAFLDATLAVFKSMTQSERECLTNFEDIRKLHNNAQYQRWTSQLLEGGICPTAFNTELDQDIDESILDALNRITKDALRFVITGPSQSGKTNVLFRFASLALRKIQESSQFCDYLIVPFNFERESLELNDLMSIYRLFVNTTISASKSVRFDIVPYLSNVLQWFLNIPYVGSLPVFPTLHIPHFEDNSKALSDLGKSIFAMLKSGEDLEEFIKTIVSFPESFSKAIGLQGSIYVIDNFEYADVQIQDQTRFAYTRKKLTLAKSICNALNNTKFILAPQSEKPFFKIFNVEMTSYFSTENIVKNFNINKEIRIQNISAVISIEDCLQTPGYVSKFLKIVDLVEESELHVPKYNKFTNITSNAAVSRGWILKREISHFLELLMSSGSEKIQMDMLNIVGEDVPLRLKVVEIINTSDIEEAEESSEAEEPKRNMESSSHRSEEEEEEFEPETRTSEVFTKDSDIEIPQNPALSSDDSESNSSYQSDYDEVKA